MFAHFMSSPNKTNTGLLSKTDSFYKNVISQFPVVNRVSYCESLIYRIQEDLTSACKQKRRSLKKQLKAAKIELKTIKKG